jgi:uncharacterized membrane protein YjgN (DUF898 family)
LPTDTTPPPEDDPSPEQDPPAEESQPDSPDAPSVESPDVPPGDGRPLVYDGKAGELFRMGIKVTLLTGVTAGIYSFWGKTRIRQYLWGHQTLMGDRLTYTGTGKELFLGFLIVMAVLVPVIMLITGIGFLAARYGQLAQAIPTAIQYIVFGYLLGVAIYLARRYRLSRTVWRGIRFGQTGSAMRYGALFFGWLIAGILTLGLINPLGNVHLQRIRMTNTWFGNRHFAFNGAARDIYLRWLLCWFLAPFTLGLSLLWYRFYELSYFVSKTHFQGLTFKMPIAKRDVVRFLLPLVVIYLVFIALVGLGSVLYQWGVANESTLISNISIGVISVLGLSVFLCGRALLLSVVVHRFLTMVSAKLTISGSADIDAVLQNMTELASTGEGLASALDVGVGFDLGL